jgi:hypothetical protein
MMPHIPAARCARAISPLIAGPPWAKHIEGSHNGSHGIAPPFFGAERPLRLFVEKFRTASKNWKRFFSNSTKCVASGTSTLRLTEA